MKLNMNLKKWSIGLVAVCMLLPGCEKTPVVEDPPTDPDPSTETPTNPVDNNAKMYKHVNTFAWNVMNTYYLWRDEISAALSAWKETEEPIQKVKDIRYKDANGKDIDRWTMLTDDMASMQGSVSGHTRTLGMDFQLYLADESGTTVCAVVTFVYAGSPAEKAGLRRGDIILKVDGSVMTIDNYRTMVYDHLLGGETVTLGLNGSNNPISVTPVDMYEDPVHTAKVLERPDGRKVGYLHFSSFTLDACERLIEVFKGFTQEGIDDMVLDLRYNGGGYVITETVLGSMLAPLKEVEAGSVFSREVYNATLTEAWGEEPTCFTTSFSFTNNGEAKVLSTAGANPDLSRLYVLVTSSSASASESLICGLSPYMPVTVIGEKTSGKYCAGFMLDAEEWYDSVKNKLSAFEYEEAKQYVKNWGLYVMYARYADCNGKTLSMPDGISPSVGAEDKPYESYSLGDPDEAMLAVALGLIEGRTRSVGTTSALSMDPVSEDFHPRTTGLLIGKFQGFDGREIEVQ